MSAGCLVVEYAVTVDMDDGQPLPPYVDDGIWRIVRRLPGNRTRWRRIRLAEQIDARDDEGAP